MKPSNHKSRYTVALCVVGSLFATVGYAQEVQITLPDVRVDTGSIELPGVQVETLLDELPQLRIVQQRQPATRDAEIAARAEADALQQYTVAQAYQFMNTVNSPAMAKKTREITLLRQIVALKMSAREIERALPLLRELKDADKVTPVKPDQAMDEEINALLKARPGDPVPPSSATVLRDAAGGSRSRKQAVWEKMAQQIGREKADGLRGMLRSEGFTLFRNGSSWNHTLTAPGALTPLRSRLKVQTDDDAPTPPLPAPPARPDSPEAPLVLFPADGDAAPAAAARAGSTRSSRRARSGAPSDEGSPEALATAPQGEPAPRSPARRPQRPVPAIPPASVYVTPGARALTLDGSAGRVRLFTSYGQATLDELIDLLEKKLAAMR